MEAKRDGTITAINSYDPYGVPGPSTGVTNTGRFRYTGQAWLPELEEIPGTGGNSGDSIRNCLISIQLAYIRVACIVMEAHLHATSRVGQEPETADGARDK